MPRAAPPVPTAKPLIVRLRNWVGDVVLGVPSLRLLQSHGYQLRLVGKPWAQGLLRGEGWTVEPVAATWRARVAQLRQLRRSCQQQDRRFDARLNALVLPFSFSSALEARAAGLRSVGYAHEGRSPLLARAPRRQGGLHELESYWRLAAHFLPDALELPQQPPKAIGLGVAAEDEAAAIALSVAHRIQPGYVVLCPFAGGTFDKQPKTWPLFPALAQALAQRGHQLVLCPGPGDPPDTAQAYAGCLVLNGVALGVYAALLKHAALMVSNDTGPGHLAAAVGTPTVSVLGPTLASQWGAWGPNVRAVQGADNQWPTLEQVLSAVAPLLPALTHSSHE
jgi:heptosyltransferase-2